MAAKKTDETKIIPKAEKTKIKENPKKVEKVVDKSEEKDYYKLAADVERMKKIMAKYLPAE